MINGVTESVQKYEPYVDSASEIPEVPTKTGGVIPSDGNQD